MRFLFLLFMVIMNILFALLAFKYPSVGTYGILVGSVLASIVVGATVVR